MTKADLIVAAIKNKPNISNKLLAKRYKVTRDYVYQLRRKHGLVPEEKYLLDNGRTLVPPKSGPKAKAAKPAPQVIVVGSDKLKPIMSLSGAAQVGPLLSEEDKAFLFSVTQGRQKAEGIDAVLGERGKRYGEYAKQAAIAQELKNAVFANMDRGHVGVDLTVWCMAREALDMICTKMARILNGDLTYTDNWVDIAGYAKLMADHLEGKGK